MFRTALRNVFAHKARLLMTAFAVMLGVTFITGSLVYGDSLNQAATAKATDGYERIAVNVSADADPANGGLPGDLEARTVTALAKLPGVAAAAGQVDGFAAVMRPRRQAPWQRQGRPGRQLRPGGGRQGPRVPLHRGFRADRKRHDRPRRGHRRPGRLPRR